jgi:hypothetical protein
MNWRIIKTYYVVVLNIFTGLVITIVPPIVETSMGGTSLVFGISLIALPILILFEKKGLRSYVQILSIIDGLIAFTGLILLLSGFVELWIPLVMMGLYTPASALAYEILTKKTKSMRI